MSPKKTKVPDLPLSPALKVLRETLDPGRPCYRILMVHSSLVAAKALQGARRVAHLGPDLNFIFEAAMLHDIGMIFTNAPDIDCGGKLPYLRHGMLGEGLLKTKGLKQHARVCATHVGVCISKQEILEGDLPLPVRDYFPETLEEKLIAWADKFYSKTPGKLFVEKDMATVRINVKKHGKGKWKIFKEWQKEFGGRN